MKKNFLAIVTLFIFFSYQFILAQGIIKDDFLVNDDAGSTDQNNPSIAVDVAGNFVIVWQDFRNGNGDIYFQRYSSSGTALGTNIKVNDDTSSADQDYPSISMDGAGNYVIVWNDYRNNNNNYDYDVYFQRYTSTGTAIGINTKVNDDVDSVKQWFPSISMNATGNFVITWIDERNGNDDIYFQRYNSIGAALGVNTKVNDDASTAGQLHPSVSMDVAGNYVIAWQDFRNSNWDIYFQRYTDAGTTLGNNTKVNDDTGIEFQYYPSITMDGAGNFVIAWQDFRNANWDIYLQRLTDTGTTLGNNTKVNDDAGSAYQKVPSISINGAGDFIVVWQDYRYGQTNSDIFGQRYFANGNPNSGNYRIVEDGPNNGETEPVLYAYNSSIIFSWQDNRRSQGWDTYAKITSWNWNGITSVKDEDNKSPCDFSLSQNYPNPFNPSTRISWQSSLGSWQTLKIYDVLGNEVATLVDEYKPAGKYDVEFKSAVYNRQLISGVYFYQLKVGNNTQTKKMLLLK